MAVFLHVGFPKTGTTTIQHTLFAHAGLLRDRHSINYADFQSNHWPIALPVYANQEPVSLHRNAINAGKGSERSYQRIARRFWEEFEASHTRCDHHIFSSESFCALNPETATGLRKRFEALGLTVKPVIYLRHPAEHISSRLAQNVKSGHRRLTDMYDMSNVYERQFHRLVDIYGKENLIVRRFGRQYFESGDLIDDFLLCTVGKQVPGIERAIQNEGLSLPAVLLMDKLNTIAPRFTRQRGPNHYLREIAGPKFLAPRGAVEAYVEKNREFLIYLENEFGIRFDDVDVSRFPETISYEFDDETIESLARLLNSQSLRLKQMSRLRNLIRSVRRANPLRRK